MQKRVSEKQSDRWFLALSQRRPTPFSAVFSAVFREVCGELDAPLRYEVETTARAQCEKPAKQYVDEPDVPAAPNGDSRYAEWVQIMSRDRFGDRVMARRNR
jgi:hypothetical protein